jgi:acyl-CoA thioesterase
MVFPAIRNLIRKSRNKPIYAKEALKDSRQACANNVQGRQHGNTIEKLDFSIIVELI